MVSHHSEKETFCCSEPCNGTIVSLSLKDIKMWFIKEGGECIMLSAGIAARSFKWFAEIPTTHQEILSVSHPIHRRRKLAQAESLVESTEYIACLLLPSPAAQQSTEIKSWGLLTSTWTDWQLAKLDSMVYHLFFLTHAALVICQSCMRASCRKQRQKHFWYTQEQSHCDYSHLYFDFRMATLTVVSLRSPRGNLWK